MTGATTLRGVTGNLLDKELEKGWQRMLKRIGRCLRSNLIRSSSGATFVEVVIAIVVLGLIAASIAPVMVVVVNAEFRRNELKIGEIMTRNQFEYVKSQDYMWGNTTYTYPPQYEEAAPVTESYYTVTIAEPVRWNEDLEIYELLIPGPDNDCGDSDCVDDEGIQEITVTVFGFRVRQDQTGDLRPLLETKDYKIARELLW